MFPEMVHVETVVLLSHKNSQASSPYSQTVKLNKMDLRGRMKVKKMSLKY